MTKLTKCANCAGDGFVVLMRSWFPADGFRRSKCGICGGTGFSSYRPSPEIVRAQLRLRRLAIDAKFAAIRAALA